MPLGPDKESKLWEFLHLRTQIVLVLVPGGEIPKEAKTKIPEKDRVQQPFLIAKAEVTQARWRAVLGDSPSYFRGDNLPVEMVSWEDCKRFCIRAGLELPREAQWEYACRAGTRTTTRVEKNSTKND